MGLFDFLKRKKKEIDSSTFYSHQYQAEITALASVYFDEEQQDYDRVAERLRPEGLSEEQCAIVVQNLRNSNARAELKDVAADGQFASITITPSPDHVKGEVGADQVDRYIAYGAFQMDRGDFKNALELFDKAIELDDRAALAYANKGTLYARQGDDRKAVALYSKALSLDPGNKLLLKNKATCCEALGEYEEEKRCYAEILRLDPGNAEARLWLANCFIRESAFAKALPELDRIIAESPDTDALHGPKLAKIGVLLELGRGEEATTLYEEMARRFPQDESIHHIIPSLLYFKGRRDEALRFFDQRQRFNPNYLRYKADFLYSRDPEAAITCYDAWLPENPEDAVARKYRLQLYRKTGRPIDVLAETNRILAVNPADPIALQYQVVQLMENGDPVHALQVAEALYRQDKSDMDSVDMIIQVSQTFKTGAEIIALFDTLEAENPAERYNIEFRKGLYYKSAGKYEEAVTVFRMLNELQEFAWNYYQIAIIRNLQGKKEEALDLLAKTTSLDPRLKQDAREFPELADLRSDPRFVQITG